MYVLLLGWEGFVLGESIISPQLQIVEATLA